MAMDPHKKRRAFGQHFLKNPSICQGIVDPFVENAGKLGCKAILEIGPGRGALTEPLMKAIESLPGLQEVFICERDREIAADWRARLPFRKPTSILEGDFLDLPDEQWLKTAPLGVISNLPYSAGTAIAVKLARHPDKIPVMVLMFQEEVAKRLRAEPGTKDWGSLSVWTQNRWNVTKLMSVAPGAFAPPPKVNSEVVIMTPRSEPRIPIPTREAEEALWEGLLKTCFAHRRKMLRSGLPASGPWRNALEASQVDGTKRAEALTWDDWKRLYEALRGF